MQVAAHLEMCRCECCLYGNTSMTHIATRFQNTWQSMRFLAACCAFVNVQMWTNGSASVFSKCTQKHTFSCGLLCIQKRRCERMITQAWWALPCVFKILAWCAFSCGLPCIQKHKCKRKGTQVRCAFFLWISMRLEMRRCERMVTKVTCVAILFLICMTQHIFLSWLLYVFDLCGKTCIFFFFIAGCSALKHSDANKWYCKGATHCHAFSKRSPKCYLTCCLHSEMCTCKQNGNAIMMHVAECFQNAWQSACFCVGCRACIAMCFWNAQLACFLSWLHLGMVTQARHALLLIFKMHGKACLVAMHLETHRCEPSMWHRESDVCLGVVMGFFCAGCISKLAWVP